MKVEIKNISCVRAGYQGGPTISVLTDKFPEIEINLLDLNELTIKELNSNNLSKLSIYEPELKEISIKFGSKYFRLIEVNKLLGDESKAYKKYGLKPKCDLEDLIEEMIIFDNEEAKRELIKTNDSK